MSQTAAQHYGRPPAAPPFAYPPTDGFVEPSRYYTPGPQSSASPQNPQGAYPPPQQKPGGGASSVSTAGGGRRTSNQYYAQQHQQHDDPSLQQQQSTGAPFYVVGQMPPGQRHDGRPSSVSSAHAHHQHHQQHQPTTGAPSAPPGPGTANSHHDAPSQPQELATSIYDTPIDAKHESSFAGRPASPSNPPSSSYYQPYQHHPHAPPPHHSRPPPTHQPGYPPDTGPSPISPQNPYTQPQFGPPSPSQPPSAYQAYPPTQPRPQNYYTPQHSQEPPREEASTTSPAPQDYYRHSELFLPNGSRAQG